MRRRLLPSPLLDLLVSLSHGDCDFDRSAIASLDSRLATLTLEHNHIAGVLYIWLRDAGCLDAISAEQAAHLKDFYVRQWLRTERLLVEIGVLVTAFERHGVAVLLLKGPHISQRFYSDIDRRAIADIDLLVRSEDARKALSIVGGCGYKQRSLLPLGLATTARFVHYIDFEKGPYPLDLHHSIRVHPKLKIDEERLWSRAALLELRGRRYRVLDDEHILLFQLLSIHSDLARGYVRLRAFLDLLMIIRGVDQTLAWDEFLAQRARDGTLRISVAILGLCLTLFACVSRYPELQRALQAAPVPNQIPGDRQGCIRFLAHSSRPALALWWSRLFDCSRVFTSTWWLAGLPFRYAACKSNTVPRVVSSWLRP